MSIIFLSMVRPEAPRVMLLIVMRIDYIIFIVINLMILFCVFQE